MYCDALAHPEPISRAARAASPEESGRVLGWDATIGSHRRSRGWPAMRSLQCLTASLIFAPACLVLPLIWSPRPSARRRRLPVARPTAFLKPPLTASALCAIFLAILTGLPFVIYSAGTDVPAGTSGTETPATPGDDSHDVRRITL